MGKQIFSLLALILILNGCATVKTMQATGGSKADATIELSCQYTALEKPKVDWRQARRTATSKCQAWGYSAAEPFGSTMSQCTAYNGYGNCMKWLATAKYQCTNSGDYPTPRTSTSSKTDVSAYYPY